MVCILETFPGALCTACPRLDVSSTSGLGSKQERATTPIAVTQVLSCDKNITEKNVSLQEMCHYKAVILILSYFSLRSWQDFVREGIG